MTLEHIMREYLTKNDSLVAYISPNQKFWSQTLPQFARFPESGNEFANMATLRIDTNHVINGITSQCDLPHIRARVARICIFCQQHYCKMFFFCSLIHSCEKFFLDQVFSVGTNLFSDLNASLFVRSISL